MKKRITAKLVKDTLNQDCILREYQSIVVDSSQEDACYLYIYYKDSVIKVTIYQFSSIWWDCNGYIYWLRAERWQDLMQEIALKVK